MKPTSLFNLVKKFHNDENGAAMSEYGLLLALIAVALIATVTAFKDELLRVFETLTTGMQQANEEAESGL